MKYGIQKSKKKATSESNKLSLMAFSAIFKM